MRRLLLLCLSLSLIAVSGYELGRRHEENTRLVLETDPLQEADTLLAQQRWQEARHLAEQVIEQPQLGDTQRAHSIVTAADSALDSIPVQLRAFMQGAASGEANNGASLLGAISLDLFLIGDLRDLVVQGYREIAYDDGDRVILALSATGLGLALLPELHWAPSLLKALRRSGALSARFSRILYKHAQTALVSGDFRPLGQLVEHFASATRALGPGPIRGAMRAVESESDLARLAAAAQISPQRTYAVSSLAGQRGLKQLNRNGENIAAVTQKLKRSSRLAKTARKSLGALPSWLLILALFCGTGLLLANLRSKRKHARVNHRLYKRSLAM